jgi:hypothetical protein
LAQSTEDIKCPVFLAPVHGGHKISGECFSSVHGGHKMSGFLDAIHGGIKAPGYSVHGGHKCSRFLDEVHGGQNLQLTGPLVRSTEDVKLSGFVES